MKSSFAKADNSVFNNTQKSKSLTDLPYNNIEQKHTVGQKVFSQPPIVQVLPLKKMRGPVIFITGIPQL